MGLFGKLFGGGKKGGTFVPSAELMNEDAFWAIMQQSRKMAGGELELQEVTLATALHKLPLQDVIGFENRFRQLMEQSYNWPLWGAAYILLGGCGDDSFDYFRGWVISMGRSFFYKTLGDPGTLVAISQEDADQEFEGIAHVAATVFEERTGTDIPAEYRGKGEPTGEEWKEEGEDLKRMFPALWEKYGVR